MINWNTAKKTADILVDLLTPVCERVEIAGSIRRKSAYVNDIEVVAIPKPEVNLFGEKSYNPDEIYKVLQGDTPDYSPFEKKGAFYARFKFFGMYADLFITTPEKWGCIYAIRTGSADFSRRMMTKEWQGGFCPDELYFKEGRLWSKEQTTPLDTPEEEDVFRFLGIPWVEPERRVP